MNSPLKLGLIYGSTREGRFCDTIANWAAEEIWSRNDFHLDLIDPAKLGLSPHQGLEDAVALAHLRQRLREADAFVVVTPEYNHGYPAPLKFLIDSAHSECRYAHTRENARSPQLPLLPRMVDDAHCSKPDRQVDGDPIIRLR
jgi:NAD(P)H-dependent FMN reductase